MTTNNSRSFVPSLRFPEFQNEPPWESKFGEALFEQASNRDAPPGLPILAITQEHGAIPRHEIDYHVSVTEKSIETYKEVLPGDFIISLRSFQGGIEYSNHHGVCSPAYVILRKRVGLLDAFFKNFLKSHRFIQQLTKNLEGLRDGKMISYKQFSELLLPWPTLAEQKKIADCLSTLDELISAESQKLDALKTHKKGLMQQLFPREGETLPRLRFPEFESSPGWETKLGGELFTNRKEDGEAGLPIYSVTMNDGMVPRASFDRDFYDIVDPTGNKKVCSGDIAYNMMRMWQGAQGVAREDCMVSPAYVVLAPRQGVCTEFFAFLFKLLDSLQLLTATSRGLTKDRLRLYFDDFARMRLGVPQFEEQQRIASFLSCIGTLIAVQGSKLEGLNTHKRGLMQQLFPSMTEDAA